MAQAACIPASVPSLRHRRCACRTGRGQLQTCRPWGGQRTAQGVVAEVQVAQAGVQVLAIRLRLEGELLQAAAERVAVQVQHHELVARGQAGRQRACRWQLHVIAAPTSGADACMQAGHACFRAGVRTGAWPWHAMQVSKGGIPKSRMLRQCQKGKAAPVLGE